MNHEVVEIVVATAVRVLGVAATVAGCRSDRATPKAGRSVASVEETYASISSIDEAEDFLFEGFFGFPDYLRSRPLVRS
ncbi:hypothetical protein [Reyranella massiliensis]|uniref:hypothetical protein n=1 Tax=Reyranella massiliensis TaxID=445220 RepID=UPI0011D25E4F|nr:hypothetical protein [Reyranella massiliensis]